MAVVTYDKLVQSLHEKKFQPVYFLHGVEPFFIDRISDFIEKNALSDSEKGFNQLVVYGKDTDVNTIRNACSRYPLMSSHQVVIIKEAQNLKGLPELESYFEKPVPSTILVICHKYKTIDKRLKVAKVLEKNAVVFESKKIAEKEVVDWVVGYLHEKGHKITGKASLLLADYIGNDLETLSNALDKLVLAAEPGATINEKDIETHVGISKEYNVYELTNALGNRDIPKITKLVNYLGSHTKENPFPVIIQVLYGYFSKLAAIAYGGKTDKDTLKSYGVMEWFQKDYIKASQLYGRKLNHILKLIEEFDLRFKGVNDTGTDENELLKELIFRITTT